MAWLRWYPERRRFRNADDPGYQGDGWRWTLSVLLPDVLLCRYASGAPFTLGMVPLTTAQRIACRNEWQATQDWYAAQERTGT